MLCFLAIPNGVNTGSMPLASQLQQSTFLLTFAVLVIEAERINTPKEVARHTCVVTHVWQWHNWGTSDKSVFIDLLVEGSSVDPKQTGSLGLIPVSFI